MLLLFAFHPKATIYLQAGLLAGPVFGCLPIPTSRDSGGECKNTVRTYSCGYSSRLARDSLFTSTHRKMDGSTCKCQDKATYYFA